MTYIHCIHCEYLLQLHSPVFLCLQKTCLLMQHFSESNQMMKSTTLSSYSLYHNFNEALKVMCLWRMLEECNIFRIYILSISTCNGMQSFPLKRATKHYNYALLIFIYTDEMLKVSCNMHQRRKRVVAVAVGICCFCFA